MAEVVASSGWLTDEAGVDVVADSVAVEAIGSMEAKTTRGVEAEEVDSVVAI